MKDPDGYLKEIRENMKKIQAQGKVTPTENALFGMIDGLAGLQMATMERMAELNRRVQDLERVGRADFTVASRSPCPAFQRRARLRGGAPSPPA